jgi:hypothetical protein
MGQRRLDRILDPDGEVMLGGQRLGRADDAALAVKQYGIGVSAAGIDAQKNGRLPPGSIS